MYMCMSITIIFYSLWCLDVASMNPNMKISIVWTVPFIMIMALRYSYDVENAASDGDPVEVIFNDKILILLGLIYIIFLVGIIYLF